MDNEIIKAYFKMVKIAMSTFREMGKEYGFMHSQPEYHKGIISGLALAYYDIAVAKMDFNTADFINNHGRKIQDRIEKIAVNYMI